MKYGLVLLGGFDVFWKSIIKWEKTDPGQSDPGFSSAPIFSPISTSSVSSNPCLLSRLLG